MGVSLASSWKNWKLPKMPDDVVGLGRCVGAGPWNVPNGAGRGVGGGKFIGVGGGAVGGRGVGGGKFGRVGGGAVGGRRVGRGTVGGRGMISI